MGDFPDLVPPFTRVATVHDDTDLLNAPTMAALDARYPSPAADVTELQEDVQALEDLTETGRLSEDALSTTFARPAGHRVALIGDSITAAHITPDQPLWANSKGWFHWANVACKNRFTLDEANIYAAAGFTSQDAITAGYHTSAAAAPIDIAIIHLGSNDIGASVPTATTLANIATICATLLAAGKRVILTTALPRSDTDAGPYVTALHSLNAGIRKYCYENPGVDLCDWFVTAVNASTGTVDTSLLPDSTHPNSQGASRIAIPLARLLDSIAPRIESRYLPQSPADPACITANPFAVGSTGGLATDWSCNDLGTLTKTLSKVPRADGVPGEWQQVVIASTDPKANGVQFQLYEGSGYVAGDKVRAVVEYEINPGYDIRQFQLVVYANGPGIQSVSMFTNDVGGSSRTGVMPASGVLVTPPLTLPAGVNPIQCNLYIFGTGTIRLSRLAAVKDTP